MFTALCELMVLGLTNLFFPVSSPDVFPVKGTRETCQRKGSSSWFHGVFSVLATEMWWRAARKQEVPEVFTPQQVFVAGHSSLSSSLCLLTCGREAFLLVSHNLRPSSPVWASRLGTALSYHSPVSIPAIKLSVVTLSSMKSKTWHPCDFHFGNLP